MSFESLESRRMFSVSQAGAVLFVNGTAGDDVVQISEGLNGIKVEGTDYTGVKLVIVKTGDGNDLVDFSLTSASIAVSAGNQDDVVFGSVINGYDAVVDGGAGVNVLDVSSDSSAGSFAHVSGGSSTDTVFLSAFDKAIVDGGNGDDVFFISGTNDLLVNGGGGNDFIDVGNASGHTVILGGSGNDEIYISGSGNFIVIGGAGTDILVDSSTGQVIAVSVN